MKEPSSNEALELFAGLGAKQKTWYYEINVLASLGVRICLLGTAGLGAPFLIGHSTAHLDYCYLQPLGLACMVLSTVGFWRLRQRFEKENRLTPHRQFLRLHSRLTYFDTY